MSARERMQAAKLKRQEELAEKKKANEKKKKATKKKHIYYCDECNEDVVSYEEIDGLECPNCESLYIHDVTKQRAAEKRRKAAEKKEKEEKIKKEEIEKKEKEAERLAKLNAPKQTVTIEIDYTAFKKLIGEQAANPDINHDEDLINRICFKPYKKGGRLTNRGRQEALMDAIFRVMQANSKQLVKKVIRQDVI